MSEYLYNLRHSLFILMCIRLVVVDINNIFTVVSEYDLYSQYHIYMNIEAGRLLR